MRKLLIVASTFALLAVGSYGAVWGVCTLGTAWEDTPIETQANVNGVFSQELDYTWDGGGSGADYTTMSVTESASDGNIETLPSVTPTYIYHYYAGSSGTQAVDFDNGELQENDEPGSLNVKATFSTCGYALTQRLLRVEKF